MADFRPSKIEVKSRKCTDVLIEEIIISATEATTSSYEINENQKCHWEKCFKEVYEGALHECVSIDGQCVSIDGHFVMERNFKILKMGDFIVIDLICHIEFEPVDVEKKEYINGELTNQLHQTVTEVALKRKHCPSRYRSCLSRLTAKQLCKLGQLKVICNPKTEPLPLPDNVLSSEEVLDRLKDTESCLSSILKTSGREVTKAENLRAVMKIKDNNSSKMNSLQITPSKKREKQTVSSKKLRFSPRLHTVSKPRTRLKMSDL
ncbi:unnamed protein product [Mytilus coruscus]|uniref:Uncharacterized protein n=1 Tax=Mytilus coruscus TaxID=42192 RepID=A0A6J8EDY9_MYTCO|nr:unnamed protein product [Mytilus coruscus]CAC5418894.1 unnamed protein product [Mytilus coruscus]